MPPGSRTPSGVSRHHKFNVLGIPDDFIAPVVSGSTEISSLADALHIKNTGAGTAGISSMRSDIHYGRQLLFNVIAALSSGSAPANGEHAEFFIELFQDDSNWVKFGPYRDASESINTLARLRWSIGGIEESAVVSVDVQDSDVHAYSIIASEHSIGFYLDYTLIFSLPLSDVLTRFLVGIGGGTEVDTDVIDVSVGTYSLVESGDPAILDLLYAMSNVSGGGSGDAAPPQEELSDFFDDASIDSNIWGSPQVQGSTAVVETAGALKISNPGTGTAGISALRSIKTFTGAGNFSIDFRLLSRTLAANSTLRQSIGIYIDTNNWIKWGLIDKTSDPVNNALGFLEYSIGGVVSSITLVASDIDAVSRTYSIDVLEDKIRVALDGVYYGEVAFPNVHLNYTCQVEAGSNVNTDVFECLFDDWVFRNWTDVYQLSSAGAINVCLNNIAVILERLTSTRAGYLDIIPDIDTIDKYLGTDRITGNDTAQSVTLPENTNVITIAPEGGDVRYEINGIASDTSAGLVPAGTVLTLALSNLTSLSIYALAGAYANCVCFQRG